MPDEYLELVTAMKNLRQGSTVLKVAENGWNTRPDADSYGVIALEFETDALHGDDRKVATAYEGSADLYSRNKHGGGWVELITGCLTDHCDGSWSLISHQYETETGLFHWEWAFQVEG